MASSIIGGLLESGHPADQISAADPFPASLERLRELGPVQTSADNAVAVANADVVILAVKPQVMDEVLTEVRPVANSRHLFVSIAAGVPTRRLEAKLGPKARVVRVMPNTPSLLGNGIAVVVRGTNATAGLRDGNDFAFGCLTGPDRWHLHAAA